MSEPAVLRGVTWAHARGLRPLQAVGEAFARDRPGVRVEWEAHPWAEFRERVYETVLQGRHPYDLVMLDHPWVGDLRVGLLDLGVELGSEARRELAAATGPSAGSYERDGGLWAMPVDAACLVCAYRPDLVTRPPGALWADVLDDLRAVARARGGSPLLLPAGDGNTLLLLLSLLHPLQPDAFAVPGLPLRTEAVAEALALHRELHRLALPAMRLVGRRPYEHLQATDDAAAALGVFAYVTYLRAEAGSRRLAAAPVAGHAAGARRSTLLGGAGLGVVARSARAALAAELACLAMRADVQAGPWLAAGGQPGRLEALSQAEVAPDTAAARALLAAELRGCYVRPTWPGWLRVEEAGGALVQDALHGRATAAELARALERLAAAAR